jgi:hypothetical protein
MEYPLGAVALLLQGRRDLRCGIAVLREESIVVSSTVGNAITWTCRVADPWPAESSSPAYSANSERKTNVIEHRRVYRYRAGTSRYRDRAGYRSPPAASLRALAMLLGD